MPTVREVSEKRDPLVRTGVSPQSPVRPGNTCCPRGSEDVRFSRGGRVGAENGATRMPPIVEPLSDVGAARPLFRVKLSPRLLRSGRGVARPAGGCSCGTRPLLGSRPVAPVLDPSQPGSADMCSDRLPDWGAPVRSQLAVTACLQEVQGHAAMGARRPPFCGRLGGRWCPRRSRCVGALGGVCLPPEGEVQPGSAGPCCGGCPPAAVLRPAGRAVNR